jgi:hypothetical protein
MIPFFHKNEFFDIDSIRPITTARVTSPPGVTEKSPQVTGASEKTADDKKTQVLVKKVVAKKVISN